ncbi:hypothetical protein [Actinoplanes regularis]|uniref:hypothetical protein n=1 Tax=Actinoplanes regularis TaxID=52697 RepID=UPI002557A800|nr:hypothetical protein [Actinoplanes regularis]
MEGRVRHHRRGPGGLMTSIVICVVFVAMCLLNATMRAVFQVAMADLASRYEWMRGWRLPTVLAGLFLMIAVLRNFLQKRRLARVRRVFERWEATSGWIRGRVDRVRPWTNRILAPDMVTVTSAFDRELAGLPVTIGELSWIDDGLSDATDRWKGRGVFAVVRLPGSPPDFAVRSYRTVYRQRAGEDEFRRRFRTIFNDTVDARRLDHDLPREAHVNGEIPPWTLLDGELFTIVSIEKVVTPEAMESAASATLRVAELTGLRSNWTPISPPVRWSGSVDSETN